MSYFYNSMNVKNKALAKNILRTTLRGLPFVAAIVAQILKLKTNDSR